MWIGLVTVDMTGCLRLFNTGAEQILGHCAKDVCGKPCEPIFSGLTRMPMNGGNVPAAPRIKELFTRGPGSTDESLENEIRSAADAAGALFEQYRFKDGTLTVMNLVRFCNKYFNDLQPWKSLKNDRERCALTINLCLQAVRSIAILIEPVLPFTASSIWNMLRLDGSPSKAGWKNVGITFLSEHHPLGPAKILFSKIEDAQLPRTPGKLPPEAGSPVPDAGSKPQIELDAFRKLDLRIARVVAAERIPKADKLLKLRVAIGGVERQIVAGIAQHYAPEDLVGLNIVVVANLAPAKIRGEESQGMLLAASDVDGKLSILTTQRDMLDGSSVK